VRLFRPSSVLDVCPHARLRTVSRSSKLSTDTNILDFKLSPCYECSILSFGQFRGFWILLYSSSHDLWRRNRVFQNVGIFTRPMKTEQSVPKRRHFHTTYEDGTDCSKSRHFHTTDEDGTDCSKTSARSHDLWRRNRLFQNVGTFTRPMKKEQSVPKRRHVHTTYEDGTDCSKTSARSHDLWRWNSVFQKSAFSHDLWRRNSVFQNVGT